MQFAVKLMLRAGSGAHQVLYKKFAGLRFARAALSANDAALIGPGWYHRSLRMLSDSVHVRRKWRHSDSFVIDLRSLQKQRPGWAVITCFSSGNTPFYPQLAVTYFTNGISTSILSPEKNMILFLTNGFILRKGRRAWLDLKLLLT